MFLNGFDDVLNFESDALCFDSELFHFALQQVLTFSSARLGDRSNDRPNARTHFEPALLNQVLNDFMRRVGMNLELRSKRSDGRKRLARLQFPADERFLRGENELVKDGFAWSNRALE